MTALLPAFPVHPGRILRRERVARGWPPWSMARKLGWKPALLGRVCAGKERITPAMADDLARVLGTSASMWLNMQEMYDKMMERDNG